MPVSPNAPVAPPPRAGDAWPHATPAAARRHAGALLGVLASLALPACAVAWGTPDSTRGLVRATVAWVATALGSSCLAMLPIAAARAWRARPPPAYAHGLIAATVLATVAGLRLRFGPDVWAFGCGLVAVIVLVPGVAALVGGLGAPVFAVARRGAASGACDAAQDDWLAGSGFAAAVGVAYWWTPVARWAVPLLAVITTGVAAATLRRDARRWAWLARVYAGHDPTWRVRSRGPADAATTVPPLLGADRAPDGLLCAHTAPEGLPFRDGAHGAPVAWVPATAAAARRGFARRARWAVLGGGLVVALHAAAWLLRHGP